MTTQPTIGAHGTRADAEPAVQQARAPADYPGPCRAWGPPAGATAQPDADRHDWLWEIAPTLDGPFTRVRPHAIEWWNGQEWIGTD